MENPMNRRELNREKMKEFLREYNLALQRFWSKAIDEILASNFRGSDENIGRALLYLTISHDLSVGRCINNSLWNLWYERNGEYRRYL